MTAPCDEWSGSRNAKGYGLAPVGTGETLAHRAAWVKANGRPIPAGNVVLHSCDNPPCVEPSHLSIGTQADNVRDCVDKGRLMTPANVAARQNSRKLSDGQIAEIRRRYADGGVTTRQLGAEYGVSGSFVHSVIVEKRRIKTLIDPPPGDRCRHDQIAAWCSWCLGHDETFAMKMQAESPHGSDLFDGLQHIARAA